MAQPSMEIAQPSGKEGIKSPTGFVLTGLEKAIVLCILLGLLYFRLYRKRRSQEKICPHCGQRNPPHQTNCKECSAPLFMK